MENTRIDKGIKRGEQIKPRTVTGQFMPVATVEKRQEAITDALQSLQLGHTTDQIAERHGIAGSTLRYWLSALGDDADLSRKTYYDSELNTARESIKEAADPLALARAREDFRSIAWLAERRLPKYYGQQKTDINIKTDGAVAVQIVNFVPDASQQSTPIIEHKP